MPDPIRILEALFAAALVAAGVLLVCRRPWTAPDRRWMGAGWVLGLAAGFYLGCRMLGCWPHWPPREDQDRLLTIVLPAVMATELLAALTLLPSRLILALRLLLVGSTARVLLHGTQYLSDAAGPDSRLWSAGQLWLVLGSLAAALAAVWWVLAMLARRAAGSSVPISLAVAIGGTAIAIMLSGYSSGGQLGLPFSAALAGTAIAAMALPKPLDLSGPLGIGTVMLFSLVLIGHFFGELTAAQAAVLFCAPLAGWLVELPLLARLPAKLRGALRVLLVAAVVAGVVIVAQRRFNESSQSSPSAGPSTIDDYLHYGS